MNLRRLRAVARKEFLHVVRDFRSLTMGIIIPMLMLVLFGYALTLDVDNVPLLVWDQDQTQASRELISRFGGSRYFSLEGTIDNDRDLMAAIDAGRAMGVLVIPAKFAARIETGRDAPVQLIVDASDANTATLAIGYAESVVQTYSQQVLTKRMHLMGMSAPRLPLEVRPRVWFNPDLQSKNYIVPGLIAVLMMVVGTMLTALTIAREWETGTMEQLISTPVRGHELIFGKLVPYFVIGMFDVLIAVLMGNYLFDVPVRGSVVELFGTAAIFLCGAMGIGLLISIVTKSQRLAGQISMIGTFLPAYLLSGFMFAISNMPEPLQIVTYAVPARYFVSLLKGIYIKGVGLEVVAGEVLLLVVYGIIVLLLSMMRFKKKLE
jgi:ABC-2 type transport system permease protein